jgi:ERCC4-related helicase
MNCNLWEDRKQFDKFYNENVVFVITAGIANQLLNSAFVKWNDIALLIVDECHHVLGLNHEYRKLMNYYRELKDTG